MDIYTEAQQVHAIAKYRNLKYEEVYQLPYDDAMQTLGLIHHTARLEHEYHEMVKRNTD